MAGAFLAGAFLAGAFLAGAFLPGAAFFTAATAFCAGTFANFFAPLVIALNSAPARKAGTEVFFTCTAAPVAGLRALRAARSRFSKIPKPVSLTWSPLATAAYTVSITASRAAAARFLSPSNRSASASMN